MRRAVSTKLIGILALLAGAAPQMAAAQSAGSPETPPPTGNADYQAFFSQAVCGVVGDTNNGPPSQELGARCGDTFEGGIGARVSSSSQTSLNPNQVIVAASSALMRAQSLSSEVDKHLKNLRDEDEDEQKGGDEGYVASFGPWSLFTSLEGEWFDQYRPANANERGFNGDRYRVTLGTDYRLGTKSHLGMMLHYEKYSSTFDREQTGTAASPFTPLENSGKAKAKTFSVTVFGTHNLDDTTWIDGSIGLGWSKNRFRRNAIFQTTSRDPAFTREVRTLGTPDGKLFFASAGIGHDFPSGALSIGPYARARYVRTTVDAYDERDLSNSNLQMSVSKQKATSLVSILGLQGSYAISTGFGVILPQARIEYEHEYKDDPRPTFTSFVFDPGNTTFALVNDAPDRNYFNAGAGLVFVLPNGVMPYIDYEGLFGYKNFDRHRVTLGLRLEF